MAMYTPEYQPTGEEIAVLKTSKGTIKMRLFPEKRPRPSRTLSPTPRRATIDGLTFHRVINGL